MCLLELLTSKSITVAVAFKTSIREPYSENPFFNVPINQWSLFETRYNFQEVHLCYLHNYYFRNLRVTIKHTKVGMSHSYQMIEPSFYKCDITTVNTFNNGLSSYLFEM